MDNAMDCTLLDRARDEWNAGRPLEAGRLIYEHLQPEQRPGWAAAALELVRPRFPALAEVNAVLDLTRCRSRWHEGHGAFGAVRQLTLQAEREAAPDHADPLYYTFLLLAENTAKVTYNASGSTAPFDRNCGWRVAFCLHRIMELLDDPELRREAWEVVSRGAACSHWSFVLSRMKKADQAAILAAPDARDEYGATALMYAAFIGCSAMIRKLLEHGEDVNARDARGATALMHAVEPGDPLLIHLLADAGADVNATDVEGYSAMMFAVVHGPASLVEALLQRGADPNARDSNGETALSRIRQHNPEIARLLIGAGAVD